MTSLADWVAEARADFPASSPYLQRMTKAPGRCQGSGCGDGGVTDLRSLSWLRRGELRLDVSRVRGRFSRG